MLQSLLSVFFPFSTKDREHEQALSLLSGPWTATQEIKRHEATESSVDDYLFNINCSNKKTQGKEKLSLCEHFNVQVFLVYFRSGLITIPVEEYNYI